VSVAAPRSRLAERLETEGLGFAAICRARHIVETLGGRFSLELGIELDRDPAEAERWALAVTLLGNRISTPVAMRTYRVLEGAGVRTIQDAGGRSHEELVSLLDEGGYARYDERTAARLHALSAAIADCHEGRLGSLGRRVTSPSELEQTLLALPGWGPVTVRAFLRELRGVWPGADVELDGRAVLAANHLRFPSDAHALSALARSAHLDRRDLEGALLRVCLCHDLAGCPGGKECPLAAFDREQLVHF
jgi:hypothetical protein